MVFLDPKLKSEIDRKQTKSMISVEKVTTESLCMTVLQSYSYFTHDLSRIHVIKLLLNFFELIIGCVKISLPYT